MSHIETRRYLRRISDVAAFNELLDAVILSEQEKQLQANRHRKSAKESVSV